MHLVPEGRGSHLLLLSPPPRCTRGEIWDSGLVHVWSVARNPQEIVYMKEKNKHFCLKTVWNNIFSLLSAHVKAEAARLPGCPGRSLTLSSSPTVDTVPRRPGWL